MDYQQFLFTLIGSIQSSCPVDEKLTVQTIEKKYTAKIKTVSLYHGGKRRTPLIYMAPFYRMYQHGYSIESIQKELKNVLDMVNENTAIQGEVFTEFDCAAAYLSARLIPYKKNQDFLSLVPHRRILDFAIIYHLVFEKKDNRMGAAVVYQDHCRIWEVTEDILFQTALSAMIRRFPPALNSVEELIGIPDFLQSPDFLHLFALTNSCGFFGASVILYPGVLRQASIKMGGSYYILPSSVHEVLLLAKTDHTQASQLKQIVEEVNMTDAVSMDFLSNYVYEYDPKEDTITITL